jgi:hypothetical protein
MFEHVEIWLPIVLTIFALLYAIFVHRQRQTEDDPFTFGDLLEDAPEILDDVTRITQQMTPVATTLVKGARQLYKNGELQEDELREYVLTNMRKLFPEVEESILVVVTESAVFGVKLVSGALWHKQEEAPVEPLTGYGGMGQAGLIVLPTPGTSEE